MAAATSAESAGAGDNLKKRALLRLAAAGAVTATALLGLWWLDRSGESPAKPGPATPQPIITATQPPPSLEPPPEEAVAPEPQEMAEPIPPSVEPPAPPEVRAIPPTPRSAAAPAEAPATSLAVPRPADRSAAAATVQPKAPPTPAASGYVVRLGVFSNPDNAKQLVQRLTALGIRAYSETRVQVGPFETREEAAKAHAELGRLGLTPVIAPLGATK